MNDEELRTHLRQLRPDRARAPGFESVLARRPRRLRPRRALVASVAFAAFAAALAVVRCGTAPTHDTAVETSTATSDWLSQPIGHEWLSTVPTLGRSL